MTFDEFLNSPAQPAKQTGTVFIDLLHAAGKHTIANSFMYVKDDPWGKPSVPQSILDFCRRVW